jgi:hypothetical protein
MKKVNDSVLYISAGIVTAVIAVIFLSVSLYSRLVVEKDIISLLSAKENTASNYAQAYIKLRDPNVFAKYEHFDREAASVKRVIEYFDKKILSGEEVTPPEARYMLVLFDRRARGSDLGIKTSIFVFILSLMSWSAFAVERFRNREK